MQAELKVADFGLDSSGPPLVPRARGAHPGADDDRLAVALLGAGRGRCGVGNHARLRAKARFPAGVSKFGQTPDGL